MPDSLFQNRIAIPLEEFTSFSAEQRSTVVRGAVSDLHAFLDDGRALEDREAPEPTRVLARSLHAALESIDDDSPPARTGVRLATLAERIVTDALLREEANRDQNVYMGAFFTQRLTRATPDLIFQPVSIAEASVTLAWAQRHGVPLTMRGAASTAMGGAVPNDAGLTLDLSRLDGVDVEPANGVVRIGAGVRLRELHQRLAERGLALRAYPSNLGGTLAGWFMTGGIGLNAFGRGRALDMVRSADVVLLSGEHIRFHDDGRLDVPGPGHHRATLTREQSAEWFRARSLDPVGLAELAGSEGVFGLLTHLTVAIEPRPEIGAFLLAFDDPHGAFAAAEWIAAEAGRRFGAPANLKAMSGSHLHHVRRVWRDEDAREWRARGSQLTDGARFPWTRIAGPVELGATTSADGEHTGSYLFVDFFDLAAARAFAASLASVPGAPRALGDESARFAAERFRPQQTKRLGPGLLAAEIVMPGSEVTRFLGAAERLVRHAGNALDAEVYYLADGEALVIGGYLADHRRGSFAMELMIAPCLIDLAMRAHRGRPYVLGRWQAAWAAKKFGADGVARLTRIKRVVDAHELVNRGVLLGLRLHGELGRLVAATFAPGVRLLSRVYTTALFAPLLKLARAILASMPGPAAGRGEPAAIGDATQSPEARAIHCINCGECNSVCPVFQDSRIRLPQMLTHLAESAYAGARPPHAGSVLLDLCMRCGNCEEVCQAGIPHLAAYEQLQQRADAARPPDRERHAAIVASMRASTRYTRDFLQIRPGGYLKRAPAALPGVTRYLLLRAENDAGPAATCIHCGACVAVCPTHANREFEAGDPRTITTVQERCVGCGTCVEICPANLMNGGQTLRVMEAPTFAWLAAAAEFEQRESASRGQLVQ